MTTHGYLGTCVPTLIYAIPGINASYHNNPIVASVEMTASCHVASVPSRILDSNNTVALWRVLIDTHISAVRKCSPCCKDARIKGLFSEKNFLRRKRLWSGWSQYCRENAGFFTVANRCVLEIWAR